MNIQFIENDIGHTGRIALQHRCLPAGHLLREKPLLIDQAAIENILDKTCPPIRDLDAQQFQQRRIHIQRPHRIDLRVTDVASTGDKSSF